MKERDVVWIVVDGEAFEAQFTRHARRSPRFHERPGYCLVYFGDYTRWFKRSELFSTKSAALGKIADDLGKDFLTARHAFINQCRSEARAARKKRGRHVSV